MREMINFNKNWYFILEDNCEFAKEAINEDAFRKLNLPHDWSVDYEPDKDEKTGGGGGYGKSGIAWYRKHFALKNFGEHEKIYLYFEGI